MGTYNARLNNCRDFVKRVVKVLSCESQCSENNLEKFSEEMQRLENEDDKMLRNKFKFLKLFLRKRDDSAVAKTSSTSEEPNSNDNIDLHGNQRCENG